MPGKELLMVFPAYNEEESLPEVVKEWLPVAQRVNGDMLFIDDGSSDRTPEILQTLAQAHPEILFMRQANRGHGQTCLVGYRYAITEGYTWVFQTDSDGQTQPQDFAKFWACREQADFVFGARVKRDDSPVRAVISRVLRVVIYATFGERVIDANVPYRLMKVAPLANVLPHIPQQMYLANAFLTVLLAKTYPLKWVGIGFSPRRGGHSSVSWRRLVLLSWKVCYEFWRAKHLIEHR